MLELVYAAAGGSMSSRELIAKLVEHLKAQDTRAAEEVFRAAAPLLGEEQEPAACKAAADACYDLGIDLRHGGRPDASEETLRHALRLAARGGDGARGAACCNHLGILYLETGRLPLAREWFEEALHRRQELRGGNGSDARNAIFAAGTICNLGNTARASGDLDAARAHYQDAISRLEPTAQGPRPDPVAEHFLSNARGGLQTLEHLQLVSDEIKETSTVLIGLNEPMPERTAPELRAAIGRASEVLAREPTTPSAFRPDWRARRLRALALAGFLDSSTPYQRELDMDRHHTAVALLDDAVLDAPDDFDCRLFKARMLRQLAHAQQSSYRARLSLLQQRTDEASARRQLGPAMDLFFCCFGRSCESYQQALRLAGDEGWLWQEVGCVLAELCSGYEDEARRAFTRALELDPALSRAREELALLDAGERDPSN
jgi:tetratricopeptide (TPR) repeat protein